MVKAKLVQKAQLSPFMAVDNFHTAEHIDVQISAPEERNKGFGDKQLKSGTFWMGGSRFVLLYHLARAWNFPSSYQVLKLLIKNTGVASKVFLRKTTKELNNELLEFGLIEEKDASRSLFYIELEFLDSVLLNKDALVYEHEISKESLTPQNFKSDTGRDEDIITVGQLFPQSMVDYVTVFDHSSFSSFTKLTKFNYYKSSASYGRFLTPSKLFMEEREMLAKEYDLTSLGSLESTSMGLQQKKKKKGRKPLGKTKKSNINIDPNTIDLEESIIPGQGIVQEFNVNHFCKVPNYFITTNNPNNTSHHFSKKNPTPSIFSGGSISAEGSKLSKNIQSLVNSNDNDAYNHSKYFYFKSYRGPGSGNYKDAGLIYKINKVPTFKPATYKGPTHKTLRDTMRVTKKRYNCNAKGLMFDKFNKSVVERVLKKQNAFAEDFENIEMLHNNLQFNLLLNTYRDLGNSIWSSYYDFKMIDFERLAVQKRMELINKNIEDNLSFKEQGGMYTPTPHIVNRFSSPSDYPEVLRHLSMDLRGFEEFFKPLYLCTTYPDNNNPALLNKLEVVKIPNANSVAWDNLKRYSK